MLAMLFILASIIPGCNHEIIEGCTDDSAINFNENANEDDGSCEYLSFFEAVNGCTDSAALNYDSTATEDDGSCEYSSEIVGDDDTGDGSGDSGDEEEQQTDSDGDGVSDNEEEQQTDSDGDGVPDDEDQCPGEDDNTDDDASGEPDCIENSS